MKLKGSIAIFAVAAAFAGTVAAQSSDLDDCRADVGFNTYLSGKADPADPGVWQVVTEQQAKNAFINAKTVASCDVPRNRTITTIKGPMTVDQCSVYNSLGSADQKLSVAKLGDAFTVLFKLEDKLNTLVGQGKVTSTGRDAINASIDVAQACIKSLM